MWGHRDGSWYLTAVYRHKLELPAVRQRLLDLDKKYRPDLIVVDGVGVGRGLAQELRNQGFRHLEVVNGKSKIVDAHTILPMIEGGRVSILANCPGLAEFRDEVIAFPDGKYDDQVDSMVQMLRLEDGAIRFSRRHKRPEREHVPTNGPKYKSTISSIGPRGVVHY